MPKRKKKKSAKPVRKKFSNGAKKKAKKRAGVLRKRIKKQEETSDVIFDSKSGETDSLFISNPISAEDSGNSQVLNNQAAFADLPSFEELQKWKQIFKLEQVSQIEAPLPLERIEIPLPPKRKTPGRFFWFNRKLIPVFVALVLAGVACSGIYVFATYPDTPYSPGEILSPTCVPTDTNCTITPPAIYSFGTNDFSGTGDFTTTLGAGTFGQIIDSGLTASKPVFTDASKQLTSSGTLGLDQGGTAASLTASTGGIVYSGASALAILSGSSTASHMLLSGASAAPTWSTSTIPTSAGTAGKILVSDGTNYVLSTPTFPNASATSGKLIISDGTNWVASTPTYPNAGGTSGTLLTSNGTNFVNTTATYPSTATGTGTILRADGTNWAATTATFPSTATTTGAYLRADGTNWISSTLVLPNAGTAYKLAAYTATNTLSELSAVGSTGQILRANTGAIPSWSTATYPATAGTASTLLRSDGTNFVNTTATYPSTATGTGTVLRADGTNWVATTATYPTTTTANQILYSTSASVLGGNAALTFSSPTLTVGAAGTGTGQVTLTGTTSESATIATSATGGDIIMTPGSTGNPQLLSDSGTMILGGNTGTYNENLSFDFETTANTVAIASTTGVTNLTWTGNITMAGSTANTLVTRVKAGVANESDANGALVIDSTDDRLYVRYGGAWKYAAVTSGFQIPNYETTDPISGDQMKEGDIVLGMVNKTMSDDALHGIWVKWDSVKAQLLAEARGELSKTSGTSGSGVIENVDTTPLVDRVTNVLSSLGISIKDGITNINQLVVQKSDTQIAKIQKMEMVDQDTGEIYCTWVKSGEWIKVKGECGSISATVVDSQPPEPVPVTQEQAEQSVKQVFEQAQQVVEQAQQATQAAQETAENVQQVIDQATQASEQAQQAQEAAQQNTQEIVEQAAQQATEQVTEQVQEQIEAQVQQEVQQQLEQLPQTDEQGQPVSLRTRGTLINKAQARLLPSTMQFIYGLGELIYKKISDLNVVAKNFGETLKIKLESNFNMAQNNTAELLQAFPGFNQFIKELVKIVRP